MPSAHNPEESESALGTRGWNNISSLALLDKWIHTGLAQETPGESLSFLPKLLTA